MNNFAHTGLALWSSRYPSTTPATASALWTGRRDSVTL
jgi:hypothetical protein